MYAMSPVRAQEVTIRSRQQNCDVQNVMHFASPGGVWIDPGSVSSQTFLTNFWNFWLAGPASIQSTTLSFLTLGIREVTGWNIGLGIPISPIPIYGSQDEKNLVGAAGAAVGDTLPTFVGVTGQKKTVAPGRRYRGSIRFGAIVESQTEAGQGNFLTVAALLAWQAVWNTITTLDYQSGGDPADDLEMVVFSLKDLSVNTPAGTPQNTRTWTRPVSSAPVNGFVGSQLSRKFRQPG